MIVIITERGHARQISEPPASQSRRFVPIGVSAEHIEAPMAGPSDCAQNKGLTSRRRQRYDVNVRPAGGGTAQDLLRCHELP